MDGVSYADLRTFAIGIEPLLHVSLGASLPTSSLLL